MSVLLDCCPTKEQQIQLLHLFLPQLAGEITLKLEKLDFTSIKWLTKEVSRCIKTMNQTIPYLAPEETAHLFKLFAQLLNTVAIDKETRFD
jgi:hypothetical protein